MIRHECLNGSCQCAHYLSAHSALITTGTTMPFLATSSLASPSALCIYQACHVPSTWYCCRLGLLHLYHLCLLLLLTTTMYGWLANNILFVWNWTGPFDLVHSLPPLAVSSILIKELPDVLVYIGNHLFMVFHMCYTWLHLTVHMYSTLDCFGASLHNCHLCSYRVE